MLALFVWLSRSIQGCNSNEQTEDNTELVANEEDLFEEEVDEEEGLFEEENEPIDYEALDEAIEKSFEKQTDDSDFQSETQTQEDTYQAYEEPVYSPPATSSSSSGDYLVIAGSFLQDANANKMVTKLQNMGYSGAEKLNFDGSAYQTVIAGRYNDNGQAVDITYQLKNRGIDCYVHKRKY